MKKRQTVFLDRDGTLNREAQGQWVLSYDDIEFLPGALDAVRRLTEAARLVVIITNQSAIARGLMDEAAFRDTLAHMRREIEKAGAKVLATYHCPHGPDDDCLCRKPRPGLLLRALREHPEIDPARSVLVGDMLRDIAAGQAAGLKSYLVLTGKGTRQRTEICDGSVHPDGVFADLPAVVDFLLAAEDTSA